MQENKIEKLTTEEIKQMLLISIKEDSYVTKCFIDLTIKVRENESEREILLEVKKLLNKCRKEEAVQLIINKL